MRKPLSAVLASVFALGCTSRVEIRQAPVSREAVRPSRQPGRDMLSQPAFAATEALERMSTSIRSSLVA
jgi:hypothetical protein